jgi:hypothetical protein
MVTSHFLTWKMATTIKMGTRTMKEKSVTNPNRMMDATAVQQLLLVREISPAKTLGI